MSSQGFVATQVRFIGRAAALLGVVLLCGFWNPSEHTLGALAAQEPKPDEKPDPNKRRAPIVLQPTESAAAVAFTQVRSYIIWDEKPEKIMIFSANEPAKPGQDRKMEVIPLDKLNLKDEHLAETVMPVRQAVIVASFPYKKELEEFQSKLGLPKLADVLTDVTGEMDGTGKKALPAFRFAGVDLERREVDTQGRSLKAWEKIEESSFREYLRANGMRFEADPKDLESVTFEGLVMPRMATFRPNQYPPVERQLAALRRMQEALKEDAKAIPDSCLIRVIDVTVKPGHRYQYRLRVRMANPNYQLRNVAAPALAKSNEPLVSGWYELPKPVVVPPNYHIYGMDQLPLDMATDRKYEGQNSKVVPIPGRQAVLQIHKWLESADIGNRTSLPIGEWSVAERVFAYRGEPIGRRQHVEVVYWRTPMESFVLASDKVKKISGLDVDFGPPEGEEPILIDFAGGEVIHTRVVGKRGDQPIIERGVEKVGYETLILSPDGKLLGHTSWQDSDDQERIERLKSWRERIKEVKDGKPSSDPKNPFGKP